MADENSIYCPNCHKYTSITIRKTYSPPKDQTIFYEIVECNSCDFFLMVMRYENEIIEIYPHPLPEPVDERIPNLIREDLEEANLCFSVGAYKAAGIMARRALEMCCNQKGAEGKKLINKIEWLFEQRIITKDLKEWADEVRLTGNEAAHPPNEAHKEEKYKSDAEDILKLLKSFINVLYIMPVLATERSKKRSKP